MSAKIMYIALLFLLSVLQKHCSSAVVDESIGSFPLPLSSSPVLPSLPACLILPLNWLLFTSIARTRKMQRRDRRAEGEDTATEIGTEIEQDRQKGNDKRKCLMRAMLIDSDQGLKDAEWTMH